MSGTPEIHILDEHVGLLLEVVAAAREWRHGEDPISARLLAAVDAYERAINAPPLSPEAQRWAEGWGAVGAQHA